MCNYMVFSPKYRGMGLVGDMALAAGAVIRRICEEIDIEVIDMAVNPDHEGLFIKCPPKYSETVTLHVGTIKITADERR